MIPIIHISHKNLHFFDFIRHQFTSDHMQPCLGFGADVNIAVSGHGRMHGEKPEHVELVITPPAASWIGRNRWHSSQKIKDNKDGSLLLSKTCPVTDSLVLWVLQMGSA